MGDPKLDKSLIFFEQWKKDNAEFVKWYDVNNDPGDTDQAWDAWQSAFDTGWTEGQKHAARMMKYALRDLLER